MNLYLLTQTTEYPGWDEARGMVVAAPSYRLARSIAAQHPGDEGANTWLTAAYSKCALIATDSKLRAGLVLRDLKGRIRAGS